jgi:uncharacterized protein YdeI (YjbR/CyaY-like superfamily)
VEPPAHDHDESGTFARITSHDCRSAREVGTSARATGLPVCRTIHYAEPVTHTNPPVPPSASDHPETWKFGFAIFHAESREQWRAWLVHHHASTRGAWLCSWRTATGRSAVPYAEAVEEALCFGWIDSTAATLDDERRLQLMTPRKPKSTWTALNRERVARLEEQGLMTDAGRRVVEVAKGNGWWTILDPVERLEEPSELAAALDGVPEARGHWDRFPPSARKMMLWWVISAAKPETRDKRILDIVDKAARGERAQG